MAAGLGLDGREVEMARTLSSGSTPRYCLPVVGVSLKGVAPPPSLFSKLPKLIGGGRAFLRWSLPYKNVAPNTMTMPTRNWAIKVSLFSFFGGGGSGGTAAKRCEI